MQMKPDIDRSIHLLDQAVAKPTQARYGSRLTALTVWLAIQSYLGLPALAETPALLDDLLVQYLQYLFTNRRPKSWASTLLMALQNWQPRLKGMLPCATRASRSWASWSLVSVVHRGLACCSVRCVSWRFWLATRVLP